MESSGNSDYIALQISGVVPHLSARADMAPIRTEHGIGALMPWSGRPWMPTYLSNRILSGGGNGPFEISEDLTLRRRPECVEGCFAYCMMHGPTHQIIIGPHVIDSEGTVAPGRSPMMGA